MQDASFHLAADDGGQDFRAEGALSTSAPSAVVSLSASEQRYILSNPEGIALVMGYHDWQQDQADSMGAECYGNKRRYDELKVLGAAIVRQDPQLWSNDVLRTFGVWQAAPSTQAQSGDGSPASKVARPDGQGEAS